MNADAEFIEHLLELLEEFGGAYSKRMFGGHGIFREGLMFGLVADAELYLKVDDGNRQQFEELGLEPFTYDRKGEPAQLPYYACPEEAFQDGSSMAHWAGIAWEAAIRQDEKKPKSKRKRQPL